MPTKEEQAQKASLGPGMQARLLLLFLSFQVSLSVSQVISRKHTHAQQQAYQAPKGAPVQSQSAMHQPDQQLET